MTQGKKKKKKAFTPGFPKKKLGQSTTIGHINHMGATLTIHGSLEAHVLNKVKEFVPYLW